MVRNTSDTELLGRVRASLCQPIVLTGLMGAGKTRVGRLLADALDLPFFDSDQEIEAASRRTIAEIFEQEGEPYFRDAERRVIARLMREEGLRVIATGGGAFINPETAALVKAEALSIWLRADPALLARRTGGDRRRPLLAGRDPEAVLTGLAQTRYPLYAKANITVDSEDVPLKVTLKKVLEKLDDYLDSHRSR